MKWIKHDSDAHMDAKIRRLIHKWGIEGYGVYWYCLELIAKDVTAKNLTCELEHDAEILAADLRMSREKVEDIMRYMVELGLFEDSQGRITCLKLFSRIDLSQGGSRAFREAVTSKRAALKLVDSGQSHDRVMRQSGESHDPVMTESCLDVDVDVEDRSKSNRGKSRRFTPPSLEEVTEYCQERQNSVSPQDFIDHYEANGWMRGKNKIKCWKACVRTWEKNHQQPERERFL